MKEKLIQYFFIPTPVISLCIQSCLEQITVDMYTVHCSLGNQVQIPGSKVFKQSGLIRQNCQEFCIELTGHIDFLHWGYQTRYLRLQMVYKVSSEFTKSSVPDSGNKNTIKGLRFDV